MRPWRETDKFTKSQSHNCESKFQDRCLQRGKKLVVIVLLWWIRLEKWACHSVLMGHRMGRKEFPLVVFIANILQKISQNKREITLFYALSGSTFSFFFYFTLFMVQVYYIRNYSKISYVFLTSLITLLLILFAYAIAGKFFVIVPIYSYYIIHLLVLIGWDNNEAISLIRKQTWINRIKILWNFFIDFLF